MICAPVRRSVPEGAYVREAGRSTPTSPLQRSRTILCASASYIAVPAAMRFAIPQASPGVYVPMALALTFPFNVLIGLPLYLAVINRLWN